MKKKRFSVEQIVSVLKQAELGLPVADLVRHFGISEQTFYRWRKEYAGLQSEQVREFRQVTEENARLKRLVAELSLDRAVLQDVLSKKLGRQSRLAGSLFQLGQVGLWIAAEPGSQCPGMASLFKTL
ncbi:transposase, partial [Pararoseomonas baculiformis]|uniref:transposase n=1 Tax=Pararoseomonas baculiformis TaxID=2820812 RepID=UPI0038D120BE